MKKTRQFSSGDWAASSLSALATIDSNATNFLKPSIRGDGLEFARLQRQRPVMHKMNFEQTAPASRDVGGPSGVMLVVFAIVLCAVWGLVLHVRL
jgi:hypothetical protein